MSDTVATLHCGARPKHPDWGPEKLIAWLKPQYPRMIWPAISTASDLLKRAGLIHAKRRRYRATHPGVSSATTQAPNDLWTADFKGHFRTGDGEYCYPLTVADQHTRFLLTNSLIHYPVGLEEHEDGIWSVYFCHVLLARLDEKTATLTRG